MTTYIDGDLNQWMPDSTGTMQNVTFLSNTEKRTLWRTLWNAQGVPITQLTDHPKVRFDDWPGVPGSYENAVAALQAIRTTPPTTVATGSTYTNDDTHEWMPDLTGTMQLVTFRSSAEQRTIWKNLWMAAGVDVDNAERPPSFDEWPDRPGEYEKAVAALESIRA